MRDELIGRSSPIWTFFVHQSAAFLHSRRFVWPRFIFAAGSGVILLFFIFMPSVLANFQADGRACFSALLKFGGFVTMLWAVIVLAKSEAEPAGQPDLLKISALSPAGLATARGCSFFVCICMLFLIQMPLVALCIYMGGGLSLELIIFSYVRLASFCALLIAAVSCIAVARKWMGLAWILLLSIYLVPGGVLAAASEFGMSLPVKLKSGLMFVESANPISALPAAFDFDVRWWTVAVDLGMGVFVLACGFADYRRFEETDSPSVIPQPPPSEQRHRSIPPPLPRVGDKPLAWKGYYFATGGRRARVASWLAYPATALSCLLLAASFVTVSAVQFGIGLMGLGIFGFLISLCFASSTFADETSEKTLCNIVTLPYSAGRIIRERLSVHWQFLASSILWTLVGALIAHETVYRDYIAVADWFLVLYIATQVSMGVVLLLLASLYPGLSRFRISVTFVLFGNFAFLDGTSKFMIFDPINRIRIILTLSAFTLLLIAYLIRTIPRHLAAAAAK